MSVSIDVLMPLPLNGEGVGYTCSSLVTGMASPDTHITVVTSRCRLALPSVEVVEVLPAWAKYVPYRWVKSRADERLEDAFLARAMRSPAQGRAAYLWPRASGDALARLRRGGVTVVREQFNCHTGTAKAILDDAYRRLGVEPAHTISQTMVDDEKRVLDAADYVFCPGAGVTTSLLDNGIDPARLLPTSYGWDPARFAASHRALAPSDGPTFLFVGTICVRKGAHLLLDYWARSGIKGRLVLAGAMEPTIKDRCADLLSRSDVVVRDYSRDIGALYRSADVFVFPSLEEAGPQVTYEACGCALPVIASPMGAGRIVRHDIEGQVVDPYDAPGWIEAIRLMAEDRELRQRMSRAARERAQSFTWPLVAARRRRQFEDILVERRATASETPQEALL
jgi:glycosyltransferase involved in cell wall biosynthesis